LNDKKQQLAISPWSRKKMTTESKISDAPSSPLIRVVIVDDSPLIRQVLKGIICDSDDLEVVGTAHDANAARELIRATNPDVVTLDIEMPGMNGLEFLERLMRLRPTPVVMISTLTVDGAEATFRALELGAVDFHPKPSIDAQQQLTEYAEEICEKIRAAARSQVGMRKLTPMARPSKGNIYSQELLLIGASTGGTEAIRTVLESMPTDAPPILIVQHMPAGFTKTFAARLDKICPVRVAEAVDGMPLLAGHAYIAPGDHHLLLGKVGGRRVCELSTTALVNRHRPSVDVLFHSVAAHPALARRTAAAILTGMGKDGAGGLLALHQAGAHTVGQNEESCVVYGMPREAAALNALDEVKPLNQIASALLRQPHR